MVTERITDGRRIAELLSSELHGREDSGLDTISVVEAVEEVEPTEQGTFAFAISAGDTRIGSVFVQPDRIRLAFHEAGSAVLEAVEGPELTVQSHSDEPAPVLLVVESGAATKRAADAVGVAAQRNATDDGS